MRPFFEQHWGMFAPNPPHSNIEIFVKFRDLNNVESDWYILKETINDVNNITYFGTSQRLLKYFNGVVNNIISGISLQRANTSYKEKQSHLRQVPGFKCIKNYISILDQRLLEGKEYKARKFKMIIVETLIPTPDEKANSEEEKYIILETGYETF